MTAAITYLRAKEWSGDYLGRAFLKSIGES